VNILKLKLPPPVVALTAAALMWLLARAVPGMNFAIPARRLLAACIAVAGVLTAIAGIAQFRRAQTTVNPLRPETASTLVVSGIYTRTRNPMYLGLLMLLISWALVLCNALSILVLPAFVLFMNRFQIKPEEGALAALFGDDFSRYKSRVRRWL
jgi:protein-S-isoprenylcysteine O-methyltransferase Ste14